MFHAMSAVPPLPLDLDLRREPFFDNYLLERTSGLSWDLADPVPMGHIFTLDRPWEGPYCGYFTVICDGGRHLLYYRGRDHAAEKEITCLATSADGLAWQRPSLGRPAFAGSTDNNILIADDPALSHNFTPFLDTNPAAEPAARFKGVAGEKEGLRAYGSPDGIQWRPLQDTPVFTQGIFDSQNVPFWSAAEGCYVLYFRVWTGEGYSGFRTIARTTSPDFRNWTAPERMTFGDAPLEHLYTNATQPYPPAPQLSIALASRFVPGRQWLDHATAETAGVLDGREADVSDVVFLTTRGGNRYHRQFPQAFVRPGTDPTDWVGRSNMALLGLLELPGDRIGFYRQHGYATKHNRIELFTVRTDGFARLRAGAKPGKALTRPFVAAGERLCLNFATSAAGTVKVEVLTAEGRPVPGFSGRSAPRLFGDSVTHSVTWKKSRTWSQLTGQAIRLRFTLQEADLYAVQQT